MKIDRRNNFRIVFVLAIVVLGGLRSWFGSDHENARIFSYPQLGRSPSFNSRDLSQKFTHSRSSVTIKESEKSGSGEGTVVSSGPKVQVLDGDSSTKLALDRYSVLKRKVFLSENDSRDKLALIQNRELLMSLKKWLVTPAVDRLDLQILQASAIDLMLEVRSFGHSIERDLAAEVLMDTIKDSQVENLNLALREREELAGLKSEILFRWTSQEPEMMDALSKEMSGPVGKKIWKNVTAAQSHNLSESKSLL